MIKNKLPAIDTSLINESSNINTNYDKQIFNNNNNNNFNNIINKRNKFNAINLFLIQDDRTVNEINNPILSFSHKKAPTPKFRALSGLKKKINFDDYEKKNLKYKSSNHVFDINKELINNLNKQMNLIQKNNQKLFYFYEMNNNNNNKKKNEKKINEKKNDENKKEKLKKISSLNPFLFYKIKDNNQKIPFQFKNITNYKNLINNNNKIQNELNNRFNKAVNLEDILILHNSTVRKSVSQIKVKKYFFKQSLKLKNRPVYNTFRERINKSSKEFYQNNKINNLYNIYNNVKDVYL